MDTSLQLATLLWLLATLLTLLCERAFADVAPEFRREPTSEVVRPFSRVKLRCTTQVKEAQITWTLNGDDIADFPNIAVSGGSLLIRNFESEEGMFSHVGDYQCIARTTVGSIASRIARLDVAYIKKFTEIPPAEIIAYEGGMAVIPCTLPESLPSARMEYSFKNKWITESTDHHVIMPSGSLHILNVSSSDAGLYSCSAVNSVINKRLSPRNGTMLVVKQGEPDDIEEPPRIARHRGALVSRGDVAVLECVVEGGRGTSTDVRWEKLSGEIPFDAVQRPGSLAIPSAAYKDEGAYLCIVEQGGAEVERHAITLKVKKSPGIRSGPQDTSVGLGHSAQFSCSVIRAQPDEVRWFHNTREIQIDNNKYMLQDGVLTVRDVQMKDLGMYQCMVSNENGSVQASAQLRIPDGFPRITQPPINTTAVEGERVLLSCNFRGTPLPYVSWRNQRNQIMRNNDKTFISEDRGLTLLDVDLADVGWYTCMASNKHGSVKASAYLSVLEKIGSTPTTPTQGVIGPPDGIISDSGITTGGDNSVEPSLKPLPPSDVPSKPEVNKTSDTSVEVRWRYRGTGQSWPITGFTVEYRDVLIDEDWRTAQGAIGPLQRSFQVSNLKTGKTYRFRVSAVNRFGKGPYSEMSNRFMLQDHLPIIQPQRAPTRSPRIVKCVPESSSALRVFWEYNPVAGDAPIEGFYIYIRHTDSDDDRDYVRKPVIGEDVRSYLIAKLEPEEMYDIKVESFNSAGESTRSNVFIRSTLPRETEPPPIIIVPVNPGQSPNVDTRIPILSDEPTPVPPRAPRGQSEDILYITLGVVLGAMLLVLIMFAVMCVWRAKQDTRDPNMPAHWNNRPYYDPSFQFVDSGKYPCANGKLNSNHSGPNGMTPHAYRETNGGIEPRPLYTLPQDAFGGTAYLSCGTGSLQHESAPETSTSPYEENGPRPTLSPGHAGHNGLTNGSARCHRAASNHELASSPTAPRPVCQIRVNPRHQREAVGGRSTRITVHDRPNRTDSSSEHLQDCDRGSLTLSLPTMPPDIRVPAPSRPSPSSSGPCCEAHAPPRPRSASSQSEASSHQSSNQWECSSRHSGSQSQASSHHSSSSKITDV
ncbi:cell adhesion molecule-related/down-regulated by oncogenes-like [Diadema antillarum]|uniref:cell adhesion molecule-related/down-regulated by oncogenes-like n=1 Tax=Diadema antillarum TaxID=105358 RepID=UPI003A86532D